jgi:hypothetical protein
MPLIARFIFPLLVPVRVTGLECGGNLLARAEGTQPFVFK